ncbi:MAG: hypothetical protein HKN37_09095 [Rhodothermales bacterium]|nr:hypothetical protein [Rhodothermales bacterium]
MRTKIITSGILGGIAMSIWMFVVNAVLGFEHSMQMKSITNEREVYDLLKASIVEPGRYACNPEGTPQKGFPDGEPVFSILYGGVGHEAAGAMMLVDLLIFFVATVIAAWMLSLLSTRFRDSYRNRVLFFAAIGLLFAVAIDVANYGIGGYPLDDTVILALHRIAMWVFVGLVVAWRMKPDPDVIES